MRKWLANLVSLACAACTWNQAKVVRVDNASGANPAKEAQVLIDHTVKDIHGKDVSLATYRGKVLLLVNTASECGFTPQYKDLEEVYQRYKDRGLVVLGFPCNDFGGQEPGSSEQIESFCSLKFQVDFPMFDKVVAKGEGQAPLYKTLTEQTPEALRGPIKWNFTKFLIDAQGHPVARFEPMVKPTDDRVTAEIERLLPRP